MKISYVVLLSILIFGFISCEKEKEDLDVETYISLLKSNQYSENELPDFDPDDIPALLVHRNDTMIITDFPHNMISSLWAPECKLGMYVLWTIESIRAVSIDSKYLIGRFPSQNPILALRDASELDLVYDNKSHSKAAEAYYDWWNSIALFRNKMEIDPLENTEYRWH
jgi:hypothetical protein